MNICAFLVFMAALTTINEIRRDMQGPTSATHEDAKGMNGPDHECDQCSQRDV